MAQQLQRQAAHVESSPPPAWRCSSECGCRCAQHQQLCMHREGSKSAYGEKQSYSGEQLQSSAYGEQQTYYSGELQRQSSAYAGQQYYSGGGGGGAQQLHRQESSSRSAQAAQVQSGAQVQIAPPPPQLGKVQQATLSSINSSSTVLAQKLRSIIEANGLQSFYDEAKLQATLQKVSSINFAQVAAQWKISKEVAYNLAPLALYNIVFFCDDSGSMTFEDDGTRIDDLKFVLSKVSDIASKFHDDGITVRFMNSNVNGDRIRNATDVANLISKVRFSGLTPLGTNLDRKVLQPFVLAQARSTTMAKPVLAIVITDGEPVGEARGTLCEVIHRAKDALARTRYGGGAFALQIAQVGKDAKAQKFLESLDNDPVLGGMIDCTSYYEMEEEEFNRNGGTLTPELWLLKMCVGAIDPEYDAMDT